MKLVQRSLMAVAGLVATAGLAGAASHSDAPMMVLDPAANITDVYSFVGTNAAGKKVLNVIMNVNPLEDPGNGVIFDRFADDVQYSLHIAKARKVNGKMVFNGDAAMTYNFRFNSVYKNQGTILSYGLGTEAGPIQMTDDARQNFTQRYTVTLVQGGNTFNLGQGMILKAPPVNVGPRTTPNYYGQGGARLQGAVDFMGLPSYVRETTYNLTDGTRVFAGQREDGFYADTPGIFDFIGVRNPGKDGFSGYNVHSVALQIPISNIVKSATEYQAVGVFGTTSRQAVTVRSQAGVSNSGEWVQVSRMGNPLFNETLVALADKDRYNMTLPTEDATVFRTYAENNEVAFLLNAVLGTNFEVNGRSDLVGIFIPDLLKVDLTTPAVPLAGTPQFNRLSFIGGDTVPGMGGQVPSGWPNGRRFGDDVVDIALTAIASGPSYSQITVVGDNVNANDTAYDRVFPYGGTPWGGPGTTLHP